MRTGVWILVCCVVFAFLLAFPSPAGAQEVGFLEGLGGRVYWQKNAASANIRLDPRRDVGRILRADERVRCGRGGSLRLRLFDKKISIKGPSRWFTIPHPPTAKDDPRRKALEEYGSTGGRVRGRLPIYSPAPLSRVRPATFEMRWTSKLRSGAFIIIIREESRWGRELWRQRIENYAAGRLVSREARRALAKYREERGHGPLLLVLLDESGREISSTNFYILPAVNERDLLRELAFWNRQPAGLWRRLGRAGAFVRRQMFVEGSDEYEAALSLAPESTELLRRTIAAHRTTGNVDREEALVRRLPHGTPPSDGYSP